jgi:hypothetical protein
MSFNPDKEHKSCFSLIPANTDPWGTPAETGSKLDQEFLLITFVFF